MLTMLPDGASAMLFQYNHLCVYGTPLLSVKGCAGYILRVHPQRSCLPRGSYEGPYNDSGRVLRPTVSETRVVFAT